MSQAFIRERDNEWLHEISPTIEALIAFLTRENNGLFIYDKQVDYDPTIERNVYKMSDGLKYAINDKNQWYIVD